MSITVSCWVWVEDNIPRVVELLALAWPSYALTVYV